MEKLNIFQKTVISVIMKAFAKPTIITQSIRYASGQAAAWAIASVSTAPLWVSNFLLYIGERTGIEFNEAGLTVFFGFVFAETLQLIVSRINYKGIDNIQMAVNEVRDNYVGTQTVNSVLELRENFIKAKSEAIRLKEALNKAR